MLEDLLSELPGSAPELSGSKIFGSDEEEIEQGIANVMAMFGVEADSITGRRLNAYLRDTSNILALESVLQLLDVPTELALVPTTGFDVASISTSRVFGNEDEELAQSADATESIDAEATFSESTPAEDASFDDEEIEPYPGGYTSPLDRSYRLVATGRRVTLAEWMDALNNAHIPYEYTHMGSPEGSAPDSFVETEEGYLSLDSALHEADSSPTEEQASHEAKVSQQAPEPSAALAPQNEAAPSVETVPDTSSSSADQSPAPQAPAPQSTSAQGSSAQSPVPRSRRKRLTPEQIRAKTRRVGLVLGADVTAQSAIALTLANVARRRRAQGKASRKFSVAAALFALNATVESALIPTVLRSFEQTQMKKHARPVADAELVHPGDTAGEQSSTKKRTLIDDLREGHYRTVEEAAPSTEQAPPGLRERALGIVRSIRQRAAKKTDR